MLKRILLMICTFFIFAGNAAAQDITINEAYRLIPHKQTPFDQKQSRLSAAEKRYLDHFFFVSDMAMRAKVMTLRTFYLQNRSMSVERYNKEIDELLKSFDLIGTPHKLQKVENIFKSAVRDQQGFFNDWKNASSRESERLRQNYTQHRRVQSAHKKLLQAYYELMRLYPNETKHNKDAFFDHLCALDFI